MTSVAGSKFAMAAAGVYLAGLCGCGLFSPRDPLSGGGPGTVCLTPTTPAAVIANVQVNYALPAGRTCYEQMLDNTFVFHPDVADSIEALPDTVFAHWTRDVEIATNAGLASNGTFRSVAFDSEYAAPSISPDQRTQVRFYYYHLIIKASLAVPDTLFQGLADLTLVQGFGEEWHITDWADHRDASGRRSWGYLRRLFRFGP